MRKPEKIKAIYAPRLQGVPLLNNLYKQPGIVYPQKYISAKSRIINFNYIGYVNYYKQLKKDCIISIRKFPSLYIENIYKALQLYLLQSHSFIVLIKNRDKIKIIDDLYVKFLFFIPPNKYFKLLYPLSLTILSLLSLSIFGGILLISSRYRQGELENTDIIIFMWISIVYVTVIGNLFELAENYRYRFLIQPFILILSCKLLQIAQLSLTSFFENRIKRQVDLSEQSN